MKKQLLAMSLVMLSLQGVAHATYPADAEASYGMPETGSSPAWGVSKRQVEPHNPFPFGGGYVGD